MIPVDTSTFDCDQRSLLLYLEVRCVDDAGKLKNLSLSSTDHANLQAWTAAGFIESGSIATDYLENDGCLLWAKLSDEAWQAAATLRREKAARMWENRKWKSTKEARA